jgi:hypothetical protein
VRLGGWRLKYFIEGIAHRYQGNIFVFKKASANRTFAILGAGRHGQLIGTTLGLVLLAHLA